MKDVITNRQKELLQFIYEYIKDSGYSPNFEEMREYLDVVSNQSILDLLKKLEANGFIRKNNSIARSVKVSSDGFKVLGVSPLVAYLGTTSAGVPLEAVEIAGEWETAPESDVAQFSGNVFLLKISGDSMINAGIEDEDVVLVKEQKEFVSGDIVLAQIGDSSTIKRFISEDKPPYVYLKPENPKYEIIPFTGEMELKGKVISVLRNGQWKPINDKSINRIVKEDSINQIVSKKQDFERPYFNSKNILIYKQDILKIESIPESSIDLIITSPPYNVDIHYNSHADDLSYEDYLEFTEKWIKKCFALTKNEGRFLLNIPLDKNKGGQKSVGADITKIAKDIGWKYHSTIIWNEGNISRRTAWGSWKSASAPYVIAPVELILVLYKDSWKKTGGSRKNDITRQEFIDWTNGVWTFNGQSKKGAGGHPAPFPIELPRRCIKLFSFVGDTVLDPFLGSGSTLIASYLHNRKGIGVDIDKDYCDIAIRRLEQEAKMNQSSLLK